MGFESLDSHLRNSIFKVKSDQDWDFSVTNGHYLTDFISDYGYAKECAIRLNADEILNCDYIENENDGLLIIGYEILDCDYSYSLLTNYGNDVKIVNECLAKNGLIRHKHQAIEVYKWFKEHMHDDSHVDGSRLFVVYEKSAQQVDAPEPPTASR